MSNTGREYHSKEVILTLPVNQSLNLLLAGGVVLPTEARSMLNRISYEPCIALLILLDGPGRFPEPGGLWPVGEPIVWMADNYQKGVSPVPGTITVHAGPEFSSQNWFSSDAAVKEQLVSAAHRWLVDNVLRYQVKRWRYSKPIWIHPQPYLALPDPSPLIFAGDAFAGPRVEGAALSGLAAVDYLLGNRE